IGPAPPNPATTGDYSLTVFSPVSGCAFTTSSTTTTFDQAAGQGSISVTTAGNCPWMAISEANWITITSAASGMGNGEVGFAVAGNTTGSSRRGSVIVSGRIVTIDQAGQNGNCQPRPITSGQTISGTISQADCLSLFVSGSGFDARYADRFSFSGKAGEQVAAVDASNSTITLADSIGRPIAQGNGSIGLFPLPKDGD